MEWFGPVDWSSVFLPDTPIVEIVVRGSVMYMALFCLMRFVLKRQTGSMGVSDILLLVLIADAAQNGMAGDYKSLPDGIILASTLIFWSYAFDWLSYHFIGFDRFTQPPPLRLIKDGRMIRRNMKTELVSEADLMSQLRQNGIGDVAEIKEAYIEGDGKISFVKKE